MTFKTKEHKNGSVLNIRNWKNTYWLRHQNSKIYAVNINTDSSDRQKASLLLDVKITLLNNITQYYFHTKNNFTLFLLTKLAISLSEVLGHFLLFLISSDNSRIDFVNVYLIPRRPSYHHIIIVIGYVEFSRESSSQ